MRSNIPVALLSAIIGAVASTLYFIFAMGFVAREVTSSELTLIISSTGFLLPLGFAQSGLSGVVVREIIMLRNENLKISDSLVIGPVFFFCTSFSIIIFAVMLINAISNAQFFLIPSSILITSGLICSISQSVVVAESKNILNNSFQVSSVTICSLIFMTLVYFDINEIYIFLMLLLSVPPTASILGFSFLLTRRDFRSMLLRFNVRQVPRMWREVLPFSIVGALSSLLVAAPTLNLPTLLVPKLSADESLFWRLGLFLSSLTVTLASAILPYLILRARATERYSPEHNAINYVLLTLLVFFLGSIVVFLIFTFSPIVIDVWLNRDVYSSPYRLGWSVIIAAWCFVSFLGTAALMSASTNKIIVCTAAGLFALFLTTMLVYPEQPFSLTWGYAAAMTAYACCLVLVILSEFKARQPSWTENLPIGEV
jgi:O-antigen/teichoic acid export membrane protein